MFGFSINTTIDSGTAISVHINDVLSDITDVAVRAQFATERRQELEDYLTCSTGAAESLETEDCLVAAGAKTEKLYRIQRELNRRY